MHLVSTIQWTRPGAANYFKHTEHLMLEYFHEQYKGISDGRRFPILNKNAGTDHDFADGPEWWKKPLKASGRRPQWGLAPTNYGDFPTLDS